MNLNHISEIFKRLSSSQVKTPLGRWNLNNNTRETALKIRYATEDNCGISGMSYVNEMKKTKELNDDKKFMYMMGYESSHQ